MVGFFVNYSSTNLNENNRKPYTFPFYDERGDKFNYIQLSAGPRLFSDNKKLFADAGIGYYNIQGKKSIGFTAGVGGKIKFSDSYALVINGRINNAFVYKNAFIYYGLYTGFEINDRKR